MALPPDPIEEVLPLARWVVEAEVKEVVRQAEKLPAPDAVPGGTSAGHKVGSQVVKLSIARVLKGEPGVRELVVEKPIAGYALKPGNKGPFLLDGSSPTPVILGRYGPDSYPLARIEAQLRR